MSRIWLLQFIKTTFKVAHFYPAQRLLLDSTWSLLFSCPYALYCYLLEATHPLPKGCSETSENHKNKKIQTEGSTVSADTDFSWAINNDWELTWTYNLFRKIITQPVLVLWLCGSQGWAEVKKSAGAAECSLSAVWRVKTTLKYFRNLTVDHERNRLCGK